MSIRADLREYYCEKCGAPLGNVPDANIGEPKLDPPSEGEFKDWSTARKRVVTCDQCGHPREIFWDASSS